MGSPVRPRTDRRKSVSTWRAISATREVSPAYRLAWAMVTNWAPGSVVQVGGDALALGGGRLVQHAE